MYELLYCSSARQDLTSDDITDILKASRKWNTKYDITGCLLYYDTQFIQILEGDKNAIKQLFANIQKDTRHENVTLLKENEKEKRFFVDWNMAFSELSLRDMEDIDKVLLINNFITFNALDYKLTKAMKLFCVMAREPFRKLTLFS
jgi:hypothetical protein